MPAGCEFICKNKLCLQCNNGFIITAPWPMGQIELVVNSNAVKEKEKFRQKILDLKKEGKKFFCIQLPNIENIPIVAYRIQLFSPDAGCIWQYDVELKGRTFQDALKEENLPEKCEKTGCYLLDFNKVIDIGIVCPHCNEKMYQDRWYANEK